MEQHPADDPGCQLAANAVLCCIRGCRPAPTSCVDLEGAKSYSPYLLGRQTRSPGHPLVREQCTGLLAMGQAVSLVIASCVLSKLSSHHQTASSLAALQAAFIGVPLVSAMVIDKQLKPDVKGW